MSPRNAPKLTRIPHTGIWYRAVKPEFVRLAISAGHTTTVASRFSPASPAAPGFEILYLAENHLLALFEARAAFGSPLAPGGVISHPTVSLVTLAIQTQLTAIFDLSDPAQATLLGTNAQELTGDWTGYRDRSPATSVRGPVGKAPTQELGEQLFALCPDVQGFVSVSARLPYYRTLAIFPQRLRQGIDYVRYTVTGESGGPRTIQIP